MEGSKNYFTPLLYSELSIKNQVSRTILDDIIQLRKNQWIILGYFEKRSSDVNNGLNDLIFWQSVVYNSYKWPS